MNSEGLRGAFEKLRPSERHWPGSHPLAWGWGEVRSVSLMESIWPTMGAMGISPWLPVPFSKPGLWNPPGKGKGTLSGPHPLLLALQWP